MLDLIRAEAKPRDKVYKMLELLEKRGPKAFDTFVMILRENYDWLADVLEEEYLKRLQNKTGQSQGRPANYSRQPRHTSYQETMYHRTTSTPNLRSRTREMTLPDTGSISACVLNKGTQQFFSDSDVRGLRNESREKTLDRFDGPDNLEIHIPSTNEDSDDDNSHAKRYKDACISPIGIIESSRKKVSTVCSPIQNVRFDIYNDNDSETDNEEINMQTSKAAREISNDAQTVKSEASDKEENDNAVDGFENAEIELNEEYVDMMPGEEYYELVRRGSSCIPHYGDDSYFQALSTLGCEGHEEYDGDYTSQHEVTRSDTESEHHEQLAQIMDSIKALYKKLSSVNSYQRQNPDNDKENENFQDDNITWNMMEDEVDKLIDRLENSDDMKMIQKCQEMFPEQNRRYPLNMCIESLNAEKKGIENKLKDKQKEIDNMVFEAWQHLQDMSNIKKLKQAHADMSNENQSLKANLEQERENNLKIVESKDNKIKELEMKIKELQDEKTKKQVQAPRRTFGTTHRRSSNAQGQSPRRPTNISYTADQRAVIPQGAYCTPQPSPRAIPSAAFRRAPRK